MLKGLCLHEIFEKRAEEFPRRIAVSAAAADWSYAELDHEAERLAQRLRASGVGPEVLVGLCADRGIELIVGLLGILKAGGAYLPIDPAYPLERIRLLLADSGVSSVVTTTKEMLSLASIGVDLVAIDREADSTPPNGSRPTSSRVVDGNLAYVIYTSGSTGRPKGVMVEHGSVVRLFEQAQQHFQLSERDVWSVFHSLSFDFSVWEIWGGLLFGGRLVMVPLEVARSPDRFRSLVVESGITMLSQTPSAFQALLAADQRAEEPLGSHLRALVFGGESLDLELLRPWMDRHGDRQPRVANLYGITETTVHVTYRRIVRADLDRAEPSPIGLPLSDLEVRLLDPEGGVVPNGTPGDLHVIGPGLARGYLKRPGLTAERFSPAAVAGLPGARAYRSGDRAVRLEDGELHYLGRLDSQLKVRGFRIEPGEIEACLAAHPEVARAVVTARDHGEGDARLVAGILPRPELDPTALEGLVGQLERRARNELPGHLQPSEYHLLEELPLTEHGKVDRQSLLSLSPRAHSAPIAPAPATETERAITAIVEEVLRRRGISPHDDLFDLGASSLAFVRLLRQTNDAFGVSLNGSELGDEATVARLARCVEADLEQAQPHSVETIHVGHTYTLEVPP